jgi:hypothetical protein
MRYSTIHFCRIWILCIQELSGGARENIRPDKILVLNKNFNFALNKLLKSQFYPKLTYKNITSEQKISILPQTN